MTGAWTREAVEALGPTTDVPTTAAIVGVDPETVYEAIRRNQWDLTRVLRIGRRIKIPTRDLVTLLYAPTPAAIPGDASACHHDSSPQVNTHEIAPQPHPSCGCTPGDSGVVRALRSAT